MEQEIIDNFCELMFKKEYATIEQHEDGEKYVEFNEEVIRDLLEEYAHENELFNFEESPSVEAWREYHERGF